MSERFVALHEEGCTNLKQKLTHFLGENSMRTKDERASQAFAATLSGNGYAHDLLLLCGIGFTSRVLSSPNTRQNLRVRRNPICLPRSLQACASYPLPLSALSLARPHQEIPASRPEIPLLWCQPRVEPQGSPPAQVPGLLRVHSEVGPPAAWFSSG